MMENKAGTFESSLTRLEAIVRKLESDQVTLDESVSLFQEGRKLARQCEVMLKAAQEKIETVAATTPQRELVPGAGSLFDDDPLA